MYVLQTPGLENQAVFLLMSSGSSKQSRSGHTGLRGGDAPTPGEFLGFLSGDRKGSVWGLGVGRSAISEVSGITFVKSLMAKSSGDITGMSASAGACACVCCHYCGCCSASR